jgi:hypothetical protein
LANLKEEAVDVVMEMLPRTPSSVNPTETGKTTTTVATRAEELVEVEPRIKATTVTREMKGLTFHTMRSLIGTKIDSVVSPTPITKLTTEVLVGMKVRLKITLIR